MIVGTAGHIDHGKTALVKALTGTDADRLAEEKARGITIELGFAYADLGGGSVTGFVDVPGHERFIHTMLAGAGGIDLALLVIAVDDGIMPQTREHLAILDLLGIQRGMVALTKADLADPALLSQREAEVAALLGGTKLASAPVFAVSSLTGTGISELRAALADAEAEITLRARDGRFRMAIDRSFILQGAGTVVTGTVISGQVSLGDQITVSPSGLSARVRGIHAQNSKTDRGVAGQRCALNLTGDGIARDAIHRGEVALDPFLHAPTQRLDARLHILPGEPKSIGTWFPARLHIGAAEVGARIVPLEAPIAGGDSGLAQLVLDDPVAASVGDRFILRDVSARRTLGGGTVTDLRAPSRKRGRPERIAVLEAAALPDTAAALGALADGPAGYVDTGGFARDRALSDAQLQSALTASGLHLLPGTPYGLKPRTYGDLTEHMVAALAEFHGENPDLQGPSREAMRLRLIPRLPAPVFAGIMAKAIEDGQIAQDGPFLRLPGHRASLTPEDEAIYAQIAPQLGGEARFRPLRVRDFATDLGLDEAVVRRVMRMAARQGRLDQIGKDHFFLRQTTLEMAAIIRRLGAQAPDGWFTAPLFRDQVNNGRKVAIEILDFFDRHGLTLRRGDLRRINPHRLDLFAEET